LALFSEPNLGRFNDHIDHTSHHDFTTKPPQKAHAFFYNPLEKPNKNVKKPTSSLQIFFCTFLVSEPRKHVRLPASSSCRRVRSKAMSLFFAAGSATTEMSPTEVRSNLFQALDKLGKRQKVLAVPPDFTRMHSQSGVLTELAWQYYGQNLVDVLPALGTHKAMTDNEIATMYGATPRSLFRVHDWRSSRRVHVRSQRRQTRLHLARTGE
jgi:hypothetical protein